MAVYLYSITGNYKYHCEQNFPQFCYTIERNVVFQKRSKNICSVCENGGKESKEQQLTPIWQMVSETYG